jgi:hypothetical protein
MVGQVRGVRAAIGADVRINAGLLVLGLPLLGLGGCLGEAPMMAELHNPKTGEKTFCGSEMVRGPDWLNGARKERDKCISALEAKGYVLDDALPPVTDPALLRSNSN